VVVVVVVITAEVVAVVVAAVVAFVVVVIVGVGDEVVADVWETVVFVDMPQDAKTNDIAITPVRITQNIPLFI
jgi:hypothetical protein